MTFNNNTGFNEAYSSNTGLTSTNPYVQIFQPRDPTPYDSGYQTQKLWLNTATNRLWELKNFTSTTGQVLANWILLGSSSLTESLTGNTGGAVFPDGAQNINTIGDGVGITVAGNPGTHTLTWSLVGGGTSLQKVAVDAHTAPGTNPVVPDGTGTITVTGGQVPAGTTPNVIQTDSLAANTYTIEVQRSQAVASSTIGDNGVCHFDSSQFAVDANAFVTLVNPPPPNPVNQLKRQVFTMTGVYTPTAGMIYADIEVLSGGGGSGGCLGTAPGEFAASGSGGAGGYAKGLFTAAAIGVSQVITVGAAGAAGASGGNVGGTGGTTSVGALISATGGVGGGAGITGGGNFAVVAGGAGGVGTGGDFQTIGTPGGSGWANFTGPSVGFSFSGGSTFFGGGAPTGSFPAGPISPIAATSYGGGATGGFLTASMASIPGAAGFQGIVIITEYIT